MSAALRVPSAAIAGKAVMAGGTFVLGGTAWGCITQDLQFVPPANFPPSIEVPMGGAYPLDEVIQLRADEIGGGGDAGPINTLRFDVLVRDPDVDQELQYLVFVDYQRGVTLFPASQGFSQPAASSASDRRVRLVPVQVPVLGQALSRAGCHRIEMLVSQRFGIEDGVVTRDPIVAGDLGTATWWVATQATEGDSVDMTGCP